MAVSIALCVLWPAATTYAQDKSALQRGRELSALFYDEKLDVLWETFAQPMKDVFGGLEGLKTFRGQIATQLGREVKIVSETTEMVDDVTVYVRTARFEKPPMPFTVQWTVDARGTVVGFLIAPVQVEAPSDYLAYETKTRLRLPFAGEWYVFWGGRKISQNYHAISKGQRFACDLVIRKEGSSHTGEGKRNEDYYCFGQPILAPAAGTVRAAEGEIDDNAPGVMNPRRPVGNHVILDHGNGESSVLAHLRKGSLRVKTGDRVKVGQVLGMCGNSGNSSEPHLHYHLQNSPEFGKGDGLPAQFVDYSADGQPVDRGEPTRGQRIQPAARDKSQK
jgi:murein DD-endopeptidase MepM/ murein hydrolase activator NlpD